VDRDDNLSPLPKYVIGITGLPCAGKGTVKDHLLHVAAHAGLHARALSFSDQIKREAADRGMTPDLLDRDAISRLARDMRRKEGPAVLAKRIVARIHERLARERVDLFVVEALRHTSEIRVLRREFGERFVLLAVAADPERIVEWLFRRDRPEDARAGLTSKDEATAFLRREMRGDGSPISVRVSACMERADVLIHNDSTLDDLQNQVAAFLGRHVIRGPA